MLRNIRIFILMMLVLIAVPITVSATELTDVSEEDWYYDDVMALMDEGIISGYEDGTFRGSDTVNVDAFTKMLISALGYDLENGEDYWASTYIDKAMTLAIIEEDQFADYSRAITRGEMADMAAATLAQIGTISPYSYYAYQIEDYENIPVDLRNSVMIAMSEGIITGYDDDTFRSGGAATRAQAATVIRRIIDEDRRQYTDVFQNKIDQKKEQIAMLKQHTNELYQKVDDMIDLFAEESIDIEGQVDTSKVINHFNNRTQGYLDSLAGVTAFEFGEGTEETIEADGLVWHVIRKAGKIEFTTLTEDNLKLEITYDDDEIKADYEEQVGQQRVVYRYLTDKKLYYIEFTDETEETGIRYKISLMPEDKYEVIQEKYKGSYQIYTIYRDGLTAYVHEPEGLIYRFMNDDIYELEEESAGGSVIYVYNNGTEIYSGIVDGSLTGDGYRKNPDGTAYIGQFENGMLTGKGTMFFESGIVFEGEFDSNVPLCLEGVFTGPDGDRNALENHIAQVIEEIIDPDMTKEEKVRAVHDYLVLRINYAEDTIEDDVSDMDYNNAYTAIMEGSSVCLGYAQAMNIFMNRLGIESYVVLGDTDKDGQNDHAWNYILIGGRYTHVDVTWDDPDSGKKIRHDFFMVSDEDIRKDRYIAKILGYKG